MTLVRADRARESRRRRWALGACLLWVLGFELGPGLHVALHHRLEAHSHEGEHDKVAGAHHHAAHDHDHDPHGHDHPHGSTHRPDYEAEAESDDAADDDRAAVRAHERYRHGRHSLAHRGLAVTDPPPCEPCLPSAPLQRLLRFGPPPGGPTDRRPVRARARGPPHVFVDQSPLETAV